MESGQRSTAPEFSLAKTLGFFALFSISIGVIVGQTGTVSLLQAIGMGGKGFFLAYSFAFALSICNALTYAELALSLPQAGSVSTYAEVTIGQFPAILAVFAGYVVPAIFGLPAELMLFDNVIAQILPGVLPNMGWALILLAALVVLHLAGTDVFATTQQILTFVIISFFLVVGLYVAIGFYPAALPAEQFWKGQITDVPVISIVVLCFWSLVGCEYVTPMVEEARHPRRDLPRAMLIGLTVVFVVNLLFAYGAAHVLPLKALTSSVTPHMDVVTTVFGHGGRILFAVIALTASASLINAVLGAVPRMLYGMAHNGQVFPIFKRQTTRTQVPVPALLFVASCPVIGLIVSRGDVGNIVPLTIAATVCWMMVYLLAHIELLVLRYRGPHLDRPFKTPFFPVPQIAAMAGIVIVIFNSSPDPTMTKSIVFYSGGVITIFGLVAAVWVKFVMKQKLFAAVPVIENLQNEIDR